MNILIDLLLSIFPSLVDVFIKHQIIKDQIIPQELDKTPEIYKKYPSDKYEFKWWHIERYINEPNKKEYKKVIIKKAQFTSALPYHQIKNYLYFKKK